MLTLAAVTTEFLSRKGLSHSTVRSYESTLAELLTRLGGLPVVMLDRDGLEEYLGGLERLRFTTHRRHQAVIQSLMNFAVERGYIPVNPIARLAAKKPDRAKGESDTDEAVRYLGGERLQEMYQAVRPNLRLHAAVRLLHESGARVSEVLGLDLACVDLDSRKFQLLGKGNRKRWAFYGDGRAIALERYLRLERHSPHASLFTARQPLSEKISRLSYATLHRDWREATRAVDALASARLHDLRHTFATERVGLMHIEELRALMGHTNIQTTLRYEKVTSARAEAVAKEALGRLSGAAADGTAAPV